MSISDPELQHEILFGPVFADAPSHRERDYVALIEAAYDLTSDDRTWLLQILRAASPILDRGLGVSGWFWEISQNKLGLAQSTISEQLKCAARKLGCRDRSELVRFLTAAPAATPSNG